MAILEKEIDIGISNNSNHYEELGYNVPRKLNNKGKLIVEKGTVITVKVEDLSIGSSVKVTKICDDCFTIIQKKQTYCTVISQRAKTDGKDRCKNCGQKYSANERKKNIRYENSLECFAKVNNKEYLLDEFSIKNNKIPSEIAKSTKDEYIWDCLTCNNEYTMSVDSRTNRNKPCGCPYCSGKRVNHTNCLWATHPEIAEILVNKNIGYEITHQSNSKQLFNCFECDYSEKKYVYSVTSNGFSCPKCSDGVSYPEKFMFSVLSQMNLIFEKEKVFKWSENVISVNSKLNGRKRYDFYIPSLKCVVETHGGQHYTNNFEAISVKTLEEEQENDRLKEELARKNGIEHYIVIDCRESKLNYIKNNIIKSKMTNLIDIANVNWLECHEYACKSLVKVACDLWNSGIKNTKDIGGILDLNFTTIIKYLKQGTEIGLCDYDPKDVMKRNGYMHLGKKRGNAWGKPVVQLSMNGDYIDEFISATEAGRKLNFTSSHISSVCNNKRKTANGYLWMYKEDYKKYIKQVNIS